MFHRQYLLLTPFLLLAQTVSGQIAIEDTSYVAVAKSNLQKHYYNERRSELLLVRGADYAEYESVEEEHPFFLSDDWIVGNVRYNENVYENVPLQFDIHSEKLITEHPVSGKKIAVVQEHVSWFTLEGHHFIFLGSNKIPARYYELLVNGPTQLLASHHKSFQETIDRGKINVRFDEVTRFYVHQNGTLTPVRGKSTLLAAFKEQRSVLQQEIKRKRLNFSRNKQQALIEGVRIYNSIQRK